MRIIVLTNIFPTLDTPHGGAFIVKRIEAMRRAGHDVRSFAIRPVVAGRLHDIAGAVGAKVATSSVPSEEFVDVPVNLSFGEYLKVRRRFPSDRLLMQAAHTVANSIGADFDIIHAHGMYMLPAGAVAGRLAQLFGRPYFITLHGSDVNHMMPYRVQEYSSVFAKAKGVAFVSRALRDKAAELGTVGANARVLHNGFDATVFRPTAGQESRQVARVPHVAYVGNLLSVKGADRLPALFSALKARLGTVRFSVVGEGPLMESIVNGVGALDVHFFGSVPQTKVAEVMRDADVVILPSRNEGFPCVVLESNACGTPVVGSDVGGVGEAVGPRGRVVSTGDRFIERFTEAVVSELQCQRDPATLYKGVAGATWDSVAAAEVSMYVQGTDSN